MNFPNLISFFSILVWSTIPFRHIGKKYFYFFYFIALADPLTFFLRLELHSNSNIFYIPFQYLALISLFEKQQIIKNKTPLIIIFTILCLINIKIDLLPYILLLVVIDILILIKLFIDLSISSFKLRFINLFTIFLILNMIIEILQSLGIFNGFINGYFYFYAANVFEISIGLFFWIFKEDEPKMLIVLS